MNSPSLEPQLANRAEPAPLPGAQHLRTEPDGGGAPDTFDLWFALDTRRIVRRRWPWLVIPTLLLGAAALAYALVKTPVYQSIAVVMLQWQQADQPGISSAVLGQAGALGSLLGISAGGDDLQTQVQIMTSDDVLNAVARDLHIVATPAKLRSEIEIKQDPLGGNVLDVTVRNPSRTLSQRMATDVVAVYQRNTSAEDSTVLGHTASLVRSQLATVARQLNAAENQMVAYGLRTGTTDPSAENAKRVDMLYTLESSYLDAQQKEGAAEAEAAYDLRQMRAQPEAIVPTVTFSRSPEVEADEAILDTLEADRATLAAEYTARDPEMIENQQKIDLVKQQIVAAQVAQSNSLNSAVVGPVGGAASPGFQASGLSREINPARLDLASKEIELQAQTLAERYDMAAIRAAMAQVKGQFSSVPERTRHLADLTDVVDIDRKIHDALLIQLHDLDAQRGTEQVYARMLQYPLLPKRPASPNLPLYVAVGIIAGLAFGCFGMFASEMRDKRFRGPLDIAAGLGVPLLGEIGPESGSRSGADLAGGSQRLAGSLAYLGLGKTFRSLLLTSASSGEGTTDISERLATAFADMGARVVLVDANLRRPSLHTRFGVPNSTGFAGALRSGSREDISAVDVPGRRSLRLVPAGDIGDMSASELLGSSHLDALFAELEADADIVIVACPAILDGIETALIADHVDAAVVVAAVGASERAEVRRAVSLLSACRAPVLGAVLSSLRRGRSIAD